MIDKILRNIIEKQIVGDDVAILMGGGADSATLLFTCLRLNKKPHGYSFYIEGQPSYDSKKAEEICKIFDVPFTPIPLPKDNLVDDFKLLAKKYKCRKKTHFECIWPFIYTFPKIKEKYVTTGVGADSHYVLSKKGMMHFKQTIQLMDEYRYDYFHQENPGALDQLKQFCDEYDKTLCVPYFEKEVYDYFYGKSWDEINRPYQKYLIKSRFSEFEKIKVKPHVNYQLCAGIPELFETLLDNKRINLYNRTRIMDVCRDWWKLNNSESTLEEFL